MASESEKKLNALFDRVGMGETLRIGWETIKFQAKLVWCGEPSPPECITPEQKKELLSAAEALQGGNREDVSAKFEAYARARDTRDKEDDKQASAALDQSLSYLLTPAEKEQLKQRAAGQQGPTKSELCVTDALYNVYKDKNLSEAIGISMEEVANTTPVCAGTSRSGNSR